MVRSTVQKGRSRLAHGLFSFGDLTRTRPFKTDEVTTLTTTAIGVVRPIKRAASETRSDHGHLEALAGISESVTATRATSGRTRDGPVNRDAPPEDSGVLRALKRLVVALTFDKGFILVRCKAIVIERRRLTRDGLQITQHRILRSGRVSL